jgi:hypothetical protein
VVAAADLEGFESFLASYFSEPFTNALVCVRGDPGAGRETRFQAAVRSEGDWQMFLRDETVRPLAADGRWQLPPNPVAWAMKPVMAKALGLRRAPGKDLAFALMGLPGDCFGIATPYEGEGHYSMYLSLFGRDLKAGERARTRTRLLLVAGAGDAEAAAMAAYGQFEKLPLARRGQDR